MNLKLYSIDNEYINYLRKYEKKFHLIKTKQDLVSVLFTNIMVIIILHHYQVQKKNI